jgi:dTDP-glucose 4,6-dehydratase
MARSWATTYGLPVIVTHCSNNYGPWQFPEKLIPLMIIKGMAGEPLPVYGNGEHIRDWLHVDDHARGLLAAFERGRPGRTYLLGGGEERRNIDVVQAICDTLDELRPAGPPRRRLVELVADRPGHDFRYAVDARPACEELSWRPGVPFGAGLRATVEWYLAKQAWWESVLDKNYDGRRLGLAR